MTDLAGHLGRFAVQLDNDHDVYLSEWYTFRWLLIPNLGTDLLVQILGPIVGLELAVRIIVAASAFLKASGILVLSKVAHGRVTPFALFALPLVFSHSFLFGFLNYNLSLGLLWFSLALWIVMSRRGADKRRWPVFALVSTVLWTCHLVGWALLCIGAAAQEFIHQYERKRSLPAAAWACILPLSCLLAPWAVKFLTFQAKTGIGDSSGYFLLKSKLNELFEVVRDHWQVFDTISFEIIAIVLLWSILSKATTMNRGLALASAVTAMCVILIPHQLLGSEYADQRLIEPTIVFALLAFRPAREASRKLVLGLFVCAALFAGVRLVGNTVSLWKLGNISARNLAVLDALPRNAQMINFRELPCPAKVENWIIDRRTHLGGYAIARRHAFSNDQWELAGAQLLRVHNPDAGPFQADDSQAQFEVPCLGHEGIASAIAKVPIAIPFLWVIWNHVPDKLEGWQPIARSGDSVLYRRTSTGPQNRKAVPKAPNRAAVSD